MTSQDALKSSSWTLLRRFVLAVVFAGFAFLAHIFMKYDILNGLDSNHEYSHLELQAIIGAFCLSPLIGQLLEKPPARHDGENFAFNESGDLTDDDYSQDSIYSILYAMYKNTKLVSNKGVAYQFAFNTWGIAPSQYPEDDPQRHGKAAYANLLTQGPALRYLEALPEGQPLEIVEVGCGTGAGANLITREVHRTSHYLALDMQQAAINTCKEIHATPDNPGLTCQLIPGGVGNNQPIPRNDSSVDFVVISETHIADTKIGELEKEIFKEIYRVLRPGGLLLWGNALPTRVWKAAGDYLTTANFNLESSTNHTQGAITARDEDFDRVEAVLKGLLDPYMVMQLPYFGDRCRKVSNMLIANFYRHPGTALYEKMTTGTDSYMQQAWSVTRKARLSVELS